ncbi:hypothetical protein BC629DRAFT_1517997 [Irpex lacteus]|nr:hypothetical protein BC629DRAFT_1517997 [Irpex lacteus]
MLGMLVDSLIARFHVCLFLLAMTIGKSSSTAPSSSCSGARRRRSRHHTASVALCTPSSTVYWETGSVQKKGEGYMTCMRQLTVAMAVVVCM